MTGQVSSGAGCRRGRGLGQRNGGTGTAAAAAAAAAAIANIVRGLRCDGAVPNAPNRRVLGQNNERVFIFWGGFDKFDRPSDNSLLIVRRFPDEHRHLWSQHW